MQLVREYGSEFKKDFGENKKLVTKFADIPSKKIRNVIVGYVTRLVKEKKNTEL